MMLLRAGLPMGSTYLLTTTGRKTGAKRTTPVTLVETGGDMWLVAPYGPVPWVHNVRSTPEVTLARGANTQTLHAEEVDAATAAPILQQYVRRVAVVRPYFTAGPSDPVERFVSEADRHPVFKLIRPHTSSGG